MTLWATAHQAPLSMWFSTWEHWSRLPFPFPGDLPDPGIEPWASNISKSLMSPAYAGRFFTTSTTWEAQYWPIHHQIKQPLISSCVPLKVSFRTEIGNIFGEGAESKCFQLAGLYCLYHNASVLSCGTEAPPSISETKGRVPGNFIYRNRWQAGLVYYPLF